MTIIILGFEQKTAVYFTLKSPTSKFQIEILDLLISAKANLDQIIEVENGPSALHVACQEGNMKAFSRLVTLCNIDKTTTITPDGASWNALHLAGTSN
jgi:hypothetical protein